MKLCSLMAAEIRVNPGGSVQSAISVSLSADLTTKNTNGMKKLSLRMRVI